MAQELSTALITRARARPLDPLRFSNHEPKRRNETFEGMRTSQRMSGTRRIVAGGRTRRMPLLMDRRCFLRTM